MIGHILGALRGESLGTLRDKIPCTLRAHIISAMRRFKWTNYLYS